MKHLFLAVLLLSFSQKLVSAKNGHAVPTIAGISNRSSSQDLSWQQAAFQQVDLLSYSFQERQGTYVAANQRQQLQASLHSQGYELQAMKTREAQASWQVGWRMEEVGGYLHQLQGWSQGRREGQRLVYSSAHYAVIYENTAKGLRQNFLVKRKAAHEDLLCVRMRLSSSLAVQLHEGRLSFRKPDGSMVMAYDDLKVWDATGQHLPAYFLLAGDRVSIVVDDREARYPITIDPLSHTAEWNTSASGLLSSLSSLQINSALYGYTVAAVGDLNGDGFEDVAVGAPAVADIFSGSGSLAAVGAVFIFRGSASGLSTSPSNILQPSTAVAGALFGHSIDGAEATGDTLSDLIIGAPLDAASVTLGGGSTVSGSIGKAYFYSGASLSTSNPSSFLTLTLSPGMLSSINISNEALFGFSVAITDDLNGDGKRDLIVGAPAYAGTVVLVTGPKTGTALVFYSNASNSFSTAVTLNAPSFTLLGISGAGGGAIQGLLFGYSVDGIGDYNNTGAAGVVVGAPAGADLSSFGGLLTGQVLGGQAYLYFGSGSGISSSIGARLQAASSGLLGSAANLFGYKVKGLKTPLGARNGSVLVSAPLGGTLPNTLSLNVKSGSIHVFKANTTTPTSPVTADQVLESPRSTVIINVLDSLGLNLLTGVSTDNSYDINCDGFPDIVVGEPLSTSTSILGLQAAATGGSAYVYTGTSNGLFNTSPFYTVTASYDASNFSSINAVALFGYSVAGVRQVHGVGTAPRIYVGAPAAALDFGPGLLDLGSTLSTLFSFTAGNNGPGKAYGFDLAACSAIPLPISSIDLNAIKEGSAARLNWQLPSTVEYSDYHLQRSADASNWTTLSSGTKNKEQVTNQFVDQAPASGDNYYRLQVLLRDGRMVYSPVQRVRFEGRGYISIAPNPSTGHVRISSSDALGAIAVRDVVGTCVYTTNSTDNSIQLDLSTLQGGWYSISTAAGVHRWLKQ